MPQKSRIAAILREPLFQFLIAGAILFAVHGLWQTFNDRSARTIYVTGGDLERLATIWASEAGRAPSAEDVEALLAEHVREEVLYREALRLGLDEGDTVIRRRLAQKMRFLIEESDPPDAPTEADLLAAYEATPETWTEPDRLSFVHVPFSFSPDGDNRQTEMTAALADLRRNPALAEMLGDPFILSRSYDNVSRIDIARLFGREFADALFGTEGNDWTGPLPSRLATHLVRIEARQDARLLPFEEARDRVAATVTEARWRATNEAALAELLERYPVVIDR